MIDFDEYERLKEIDNSLGGFTNTPQKEIWNNHTFMITAGKRRWIGLTLILQ